MGRTCLASSVGEARRAVRGRSRLGLGCKWTVTAQSHREDGFTCVPTSMPSVKPAVMAELAAAAGQHLAETAGSSTATSLLADRPPAGSQPPDPGGLEHLRAQQSWPALCARSRPRLGPWPQTLPAGLQVADGGGPAVRSLRCGCAGWSASGSRGCLWAARCEPFYTLASSSCGTPHASCRHQIPARNTTNRCTLSRHYGYSALRRPTPHRKLQSRQAAPSAREEAEPSARAALNGVHNFPWPPSPQAACKSASSACLAPASASASRPTSRSDATTSRVRAAATARRLMTRAPPRAAPRGCRPCRPRSRYPRRRRTRRQCTLRAHGRRPRGRVRCEPL